MMHHHVNKIPLLYPNISQLNSVQNFAPLATFLPMSMSCK